MEKPTKRSLSRGYVLKPGEGIPGFDSSVKAGRSSTGAAISLIESHTRGGAPRHVHAHEDECFYVLEGTIIVHCGGQTFEAGPRSFVFLPRGIPHDWDVFGGGTASLLMITVPGMLEEFLQEFHGATADTRDKIAGKYGMKFLHNSSPDS